MDEFDALLASCRTPVERWLKAHMGNCHDAEDVLQETCLAAFQGFPGLKNREAFLPWMLGIARRKCADWYRNQAREKNALMALSPQMPVPPPGIPAVEETLETLPERDRLMLRLFYLEQLSQKQIASQLHIPQGTVKSRMNAARARFKSAFPCPPGGGMVMEKNKQPALPSKMPDYTIVWENMAAFPAECRELTGWFITPDPGEQLYWGMYDFPSRKLDIAYRMTVTGPARVHGLDGVSILAQVLEPRPDVDQEDPMSDAVNASCGGQDAWTFVAQEKDGYTRFLSAEHLEDDGVRVLTTFLDGEAFMQSWGFGEDNCGAPVHREAQGRITRSGPAVTVSPDGPCMDVVGRCTVNLGGKTYDTVCVMDLGMYEEGMVSEQYVDRDGRTVLWRRFNRDDWNAACYGGTWSELLPDNEQITINGQRYVHWYDCLCLR